MGIEGSSGYGYGGHGERRSAPLSIIDHWGSRPEERADRYPCDALLPDADAALYRAVDVAASPATVFRWLCQLRAAPYSYDWIDNGGKRSPPTLTSGLEQLALGQRVMRIFSLVDYERDEHLTLVLDDPPGQRAFGHLAATYRVKATERGSRLVVKLLVRRPRGVFRWLAPALPLGDFIMMRKQLLTLKRYAEQSEG